MGKDFLSLCVSVVEDPRQHLQLLVSQNLLVTFGEARKDASTWMDGDSDGHHSCQSLCQRYLSLTLCVFIH